jgi:protein gp37
MSGETAIEWATHTWNPTTGCDKVSPGCDHCYAMTLAPRLKGMGSKAYQLDGDARTSGPGFLAHEWPAALDWPLHKRKPMRVFVNSMSDLFHANISDEYIARVFDVMERSPQHTFQILTKRHARMKAWTTAHRPTPLPNVWLGVSVESQQWANLRIPALVHTPAAVRFLSCEPLLGPVTFRWAMWQPFSEEPGGVTDHLDGLRRLDWVIAGGESGPGSRPMHPDWVRTIRDQCVEADVAFLFKQWGSHDAAGQPMNKHAAGRELDERTWDEYPQAVQS